MFIWKLGVYFVLKKLSNSADTFHEVKRKRDRKKTVSVSPNDYVDSD